MTHTLDEFETDDGNGAWCEQCLAMSDAALRGIDEAPEGNRISYDDLSGRFLCEPCRFPMAWAEANGLLG